MNDNMPKQILAMQDPDTQDKRIFCFLLCVHITMSADPILGLYKVC